MKNSIYYCWFGANHAALAKKCIKAGKKYLPGLSDHALT
jgi:hypothetical protein